MRALHFILASIGLLASAAPAAAQATEPFIGQTMTTAGSFCPTGWADMNGQVMQISSNTALYQVIGNAYGGDITQSTFALPAAKPLFTATGVPLRQCIALEGIFPSDPLD
jgi:microcystin-dependent protein